MLIMRRGPGLEGMNVSQALQHCIEVANILGHILEGQRQWCILHCSRACRRRYPALLSVTSVAASCTLRVLAEVAVVGCRNVIAETDIARFDGAEGTAAVAMPWEMAGGASEHCVLGL